MIFDAISFLPQGSYAWRRKGGQELPRISVHDQRISPRVRHFDRWVCLFIFRPTFGRPLGAHLNKHADNEYLTKFAKLFFRVICFCVNWKLFSYIHRFDIELICQGSSMFTSFWGNWGVVHKLRYSWLSFKVSCIHFFAPLTFSSHLAPEHLPFPKPSPITSPLIPFSHSLLP